MAPRDGAVSSACPLTNRSLYRDQWYACVDPSIYAPFPTAGPAGPARYMQRSTRSGPRVTAFAVVAFWAALAPGAPAAQTPGVSTGSAEWAAPRTDGPRVRVLSEDAASVTVEVTATWAVPLADALARASERSEGLTASGLALAAGDGRAAVSHEVALSARVPPAVEVVSEDVEWVALASGQAAALAGLAGPAAEVVNVSELRRQLVGSLALRVLRVEGTPGGERVGRVRRLVVRVPRPAMRVAFASRGGGNPHVAVTRSVLADGRWYRIAVPREGVFRLTAAFLRDSLRVENADLARVQVYGNGGRTLPAITDAPRPADLREVPTLVQGDAVLFFAEGPSWWDWVGGTFRDAAHWQHDLSPFSTATHYFVRVDAPAPRRLAAEAFPAWPDAERLSTVVERRFHERDLFNFERDLSGSGLDWLGEDLTSGSVSVLAGAAPAGLAGPVTYRARVGARTGRSAVVTMSAGGQAVASAEPPAVDLGFQNNGNLLTAATMAGERSAPADLGVTFAASGLGGGKAWLDWVEATMQRAPVAAGGVVRFATPGGRRGRFEVALQGFASAPEVWDVTESGSIRRLGVRAEAGAFVVQVEAVDREREVVAFDAAGAYVSTPPRGGAAVANQNLHGLTGSPAYVVVTHTRFAAQAERLAAYRRQRDGLETVVVTTDQIYNEFASGSSDMRAVRDYMKFLYDRAPDAARIPRYLLLFGDGHFDFRNITRTNVPNFVPVYETDDMFSRINSYTSDDYFALLADGDGVWDLIDTTERVQLGVGRLPVRTAAEAATMVDKIEEYEGAATRGDWRTRATFIGDDQYPNPNDNDLHVLNADETAKRIAVVDPTITLQKIYAPSFPLVTTAAGNRRPAVNDAIVRSLNEGTLVWNYSGHGSPERLGDERYFTEEVKDQLENRDRLSIFVTATCSFGKFDIAASQSMAEEVLLREAGGGIAMFTTVRLVYTGSSVGGEDNFGLNITLTEDMFEREAGGRPKRLGDILFETKNTRIGASLNNRKFNLLGDPAMRIGLPERRIAVESPAAFRAYDEATVRGRVLGANGQTDAAFSGEVDVEVFDALRVVRMPATPPQFQLPVYIPQGEYTVQTDALYAGRATVRAGEFSATFRVPQDVSYSGLPAKVTAYAVGSGAARLDAVGASLDGVVSAQAGARPDDGAGPSVRLFIGDTTFVSGGLARPDAVLVARLSDASGINTVGAGVGHEILLTIDGDVSTAVDVGRYYTGDLDTYRSGTIRFPLPRLAPGAHTARLTAWDGVNNSTTAEVAFTISDAVGMEVTDVFPYPNPTAGPTRFTFAHNLPAGTPARVQVRIFTVAGRPVRTIDGDEALPGGVLPGGLVQIPWDGRDDDLDRLGSGVYLYRLRVEADGADGGAAQVVERVERLAIIR